MSLRKKISDWVGPEDDAIDSAPWYYVDHVYKGGCWQSIIFILINIWLFFTLSDWLMALYKGYYLFLASPLMTSIFGLFVGSFIHFVSRGPRWVYRRYYAYGSFVLSIVIVMHAGWAILALVS